MLLSSGVVWRHRTLRGLSARSARRRSRSPAPRSSRSSTTRSTGSSRSASRPVARETGNPRTVGSRFDPRGLTEALVRAAGDVRLGGAVRGGADPRDGRFRRAGSRASAGCCCARIRGARATGSPSRSRAARPSSAGMDEFYGRTLPGARAGGRVRRGGAAVRASRARARRRRAQIWASRRGPRATSCSGFPGGAAWYVVDARALRERTPYGTVAELVDVARAAGGDVRPAEELPFRAASVAEARPSRRSPPSACTRPSRTRSAGCASTSRRASSTRRRARPGSVRRGRRRGRHLHRRLRQRPRRRARLRPHRRRDRAQLTSGELGVRAAAAVARQRRRADLADPQQRVAVLDRRADGRWLALALLQRPAGRRPDEEHIAGTAP